jgi:hypothetical protein
LNFDSIAEPSTAPFDPSTSLSTALLQHRHEQDVHRDDHGVAAAMGPSSAITAIPLPPQQPSGQGGLAQDEEEEWEIKKILDRRWTERGYDYKVRWNDTWLPGRELVNTQDLLGAFEAEAIMCSLDASGADRHAHIAVGDL